MLILIGMAAGVLVGAKWFPEKYQRFNAWVQMACTVLLIFCMGVSLGGRPNFLADLKTLGVDAFLFAAVPILCSILAVYVLSQWFLVKKKPETCVLEQKESEKGGDS